MYFNYFVFERKGQLLRKKMSETKTMAVAGVAIGTAALIFAGVNRGAITSLETNVATLQSAVGGLLIPTGEILVGNDAGAAANVAMSGGATMDSAGVVTLNPTFDELIVKNALGDEVKITAPVATFTNYELVLPPNDGDASQVLTTDGAGVLSWETPSAVSLGESRFYGLTAGTGNDDATDYAATVAAGAPVPFPRDGYLSGSIVRASTTSFTLPVIGTYEISWIVHTTEPGQLQLDVDSVVVASSTVVNMNPTSGGHPFIGNDIVTTTVDNAVVRVLNPAGNSPALTITPANGTSTHANAQSLKIRRIA